MKSYAAFLNTRVHNYPHGPYSDRGTVVTERVSSHGGNERCWFFFSLLLRLFAAVPLHSRILDVKHVASWVLGGLF